MPSKHVNTSCRDIALAEPVQVDFWLCRTQMDYHPEALPHIVEQGCSNFSQSYQDHKHNMNVYRDNGTT